MSYSHGIENNFQLTKKCKSHQLEQDNFYINIFTLDD